jgi:hypothetical protein
MVFRAFPGEGLLKGCKNREKSSEKSIMRVENQGEGIGGVKRGCGAAEGGWRDRAGGSRGGRSIHFEYFLRGGAGLGKGGAKKRPSVETEGRLTIACHMKILQKIDVDGTGFLCLFTIPFFTGDTKIITQTYSENISMIPNG